MTKSGVIFSEYYLNWKCLCFSQASFSSIFLNSFLIKSHILVL